MLVGYHAEALSIHRFELPGQASQPQPAHSNCSWRRSSGWVDDWLFTSSDTDQKVSATVCCRQTPKQETEADSGLQFFPAGAATASGQATGFGRIVAIHQQHPEQDDLDHFRIQMRRIHCVTAHGFLQLDELR